MRYRLVVLTHGDCAPLEATLASFAEHVTPEPTSCVLVYDGRDIYGHGSPSPDLSAVAVERPWLVATTVEGPRGFCEATARAWRLAGEGDHEYVFYLEHDFRFLRPVDLRELAFVMERRPRLAQMALMRDAVSEEEHAAGGLYELRRDGYSRHRAFLKDREKGVTRGGIVVSEGRTRDWLSHEMYFTTNPSLMRRDFMAYRPWPAYPEQCEGRFGIDLVAAGRTFGVWGAGEPWVTHAGVRTGFGY